MSRSGTETRLRKPEPTVRNSNPGFVGSANAAVPWGFAPGFRLASRLPPEISHYPFLTLPGQGLNNSICGSLKKS